MATYTVTINERTKAGKSLVKYLRNLGVLDETNKATMAGVKEIQHGGGTRCESFDEYLKTVSVL